MTPFASILQSLCRSRGILYKQLAYQLGVDPSYLSALISGRKGRPNEKFVQKLQDVLVLNEVERHELLEAVKSSQLRYTVSEKAAPREHEIVRRLIEAVGQLKPAQIDIIDAALKL